MLGAACRRRCVHEVARSHFITHCLRVCFLGGRRRHNISDDIVVDGHTALITSVQVAPSAHQGMFLVQQSTPSHPCQLKKLA